MPIGSYRKIILVLLCLALLTGTAAFAQEARLTDVIVTNTRDDLLVYLTVEGAFTADMKAAIKSGVPATFSFFVNLYRSRNWWFDKKIAERTITHTIKYDNLKKKYRVQRSWETEPHITQSFSEAQKLMTEVDSLTMVPLAKLKKGTAYQIQAKAALSKRTLPLKLHYVLFFLSLWDFETDWYTIDFIY
jgi:hypothetical protein